MPSSARGHWVPRQTSHVLHVEPGHPAGLLVETLPRFPDSFGGLRHVLYHAFPAPVDATVRPGTLVEIDYDPFDDYRIATVRSRREFLYVAPERYYIAGTAGVPRDGRRRPFTFHAHGLTDPGLAVTIAQVGPPPAGLPPCTIRWSDVVRVVGRGRYAATAIYSHYPDRDAEGHYLVADPSFDGAVRLDARRPATSIVP